jgi:hypothetical protein
VPPSNKICPSQAPSARDRCDILWLKEGTQRNSTCPNYAVPREPTGETPLGASVLTLTKPKRRRRLPGLDVETVRQGPADSVD